MERAKRLGEFLRARREQVTPDDVGLPTDERRRVPGLRREELAMLAGVSADYYVRLEQGRDHRPSEQVLDALARVLRLGDDATAHLYELARPAPPVRRASRAADAPVPAVLQELVDTWGTTPAIVQSRHLDVLASNAIARALAPCYEPGVNLLRGLFLDPAIRELHGDELDHVLGEAVAAFRAWVGGDTDDPELQALVGELSLKSEGFRELWARHDVQASMTGEKRFLHPTVGTFRLRYQVLAVPGTEGASLCVMHAPPGTADAQALALLATLTADGAAAREPRPDRASR
ncbi:helix-turn-helix transcriptional regulator [Patulibacter sp. SYSU D01012]|uniref:helix-turn-helix transcriptional regulator n=1 Tax=Patulibacter sp. SYSU D01012 TaxID=2817381 RepID=UPI001B30FEFE|nr:helix-turn-helix transcriptional regulator [Patulibacter sp. SYSU D01012]